MFCDFCAGWMESGCMKSVRGTSKSAACSASATSEAACTAEDPCSVTGPGWPDSAGWTDTLALRLRERPAAGRDAATCFLGCFFAWEGAFKETDGVAGSLTSLWSAGGWLLEDGVKAIVDVKFLATACTSYCCCCCRCCCDASLISWRPRLQHRRRRREQLSHSLWNQLCLNSARNEQDFKTLQRHDARCLHCSAANEAWIGNATKAALVCVGVARLPCCWRRLAGMSSKSLVWEFQNRGPGSD